jgi:hypothetical protein
MKYFVRVGSENKGPLSIDDLRARGVQPSDYVWRDGLADWQPAGTLPELAVIMHRPLAANKSIYEGDPSSPYAPPMSTSFPEYPQRAASGPLRQSGYGIASTILGVGTVAAVFVGLMIIGAMQQNGANAREPTPLMIAMSLGICFGGPLFQLAGLILGIIGIFQHDRSKLFGIMGTVINGLVIFGMIALMIVGFLIAAAAR